MRTLIEKYHIDRGVLSVLLAVAVSAVLGDYFIHRQMMESYKKEQAVRVTQLLATARINIEATVHTNFSMIYAVAASVSSRPKMSEREFELLAKTLLRHGDALANIAAAPDFVISYVYPRKGNEKLVGLDYRMVPEQWPKALAARETGEMLLDGPVNLIQGGRGLVARVPVFNGETDEFWGLVSAVINFDVLIDQSGIRAKLDQIQLALRKKESRVPLWGDPSLFENSSDPIVMGILLPSTEWEIVAVPMRGWVKKHPRQWLLHVSTLLFTMLVGIIVIQKRRNKQHLMESENRLKAMSLSSHDALIMIDSDDRIIFWNPAAEVMFGYSEDEVSGKKMHDIIVKPEDRGMAVRGLSRFLKTGTGPVMNCVMEMEAVRKSGEIFPVERSVSAFLLNGTWCAVGSIRDITARKQYEDRLTRLARTDELTGLSNRRFFLEMSGMELKKALRYKKAFSVMLFDIDHFKKINDTYGHDAGDKVLQAVAGTVMKVMRETDIPGRVGGEEFAIALPETDLPRAWNAAERLRQTLMKIRVDIGSSEIGLTASIGVTQMETENTDMAMMLKKADECMYEAKNLGRNRVVATH